jgi:hypothetical protein
VTAATGQLVPVIDLGGDAADVARQIDEACTRVGFFQIVGHGSDPVVERAAWDAARDFFALPDADKLAVAIPPGDAYGYGPFKVERLAASLGEATPPDLKETFSVGPFAPPPPGLDDPAAAFVYSPNRWPESLPHMEAVMRAHYESQATLVARLMASMADALGLAHVGAARLALPRPRRARRGTGPAACRRPLRLRHADAAAPRRCAWRTPSSGCRRGVARRRSHTRCLRRQRRRRLGEVDQRSLGEHRAPRGRAAG